MIRPPGPPPRLNRLVGPTSGAYEGNARFGLAVLGLVFANLFIGALLAATWVGVPGMADFLKIIAPTVLAADIVGAPFYFGHRSGEQAP